jgi:hypothetical protein
MTDGTIDRRRLLRGAGLVAGGAAASTGMGAMVAPVSAHSDGWDTRGLAGSWLVDVKNDDGSTLVSVGSFAEGGVAIVHDISPAGPPFTGTWELRDDDRWRATVWSGFPGDGPNSPGGTVRLRLRGEFGEDWISGSFTFTAYDSKGAEVDEGSGTFSGRPIDA